MKKKEKISEMNLNISNVDYELSNYAELLKKAIVPGKGQVNFCFLSFLLTFTRKSTALIL